MATIDSVKLPDNSTYDLTDNYSGYAKKVAGATTDDLASLTATGDLADSGKKLSDLVLKSDVKDVLNSTSTTDPLSANQGRVLAENIEAIVNVYGSKNLNNYPYYNTTKTVNDITFTDNGDGTVTVSGTASDTASFYCHALPAYDNNPLSLKAGKYLITGCPNGGSDNTYYMWFTYNTEYHDTGSGLEVNLPNDTSNISYGIVIAAGTAITTPITFKPMIRDARMADPTFVPFAKTNKQLTTELKSLAFNSPLRKGLDAGSSVSYTVPNGVYLVTSWQTGASVEFSGLWIAFVTPYAEGCSVFTLVTPNYITVSVSANTITFTHTGSIYFVQTNITCITEEIT